MAFGGGKGGAAGMVKNALLPAWKKPKKRGTPYFFQHKRTGGAFEEGKKEEPF